MSLLTRPPEQAEPTPGETRRRRTRPRPRSERATHMPRFRMPHGLTSARFIVSVGVLLAAGLVALLAVNTSLAAGAIKLGSLESELARATERQQAVGAEVEALTSPAALQSAAWALGMVPAASPVFLDPATGTVSGALTPAPAQAKPPEQAPQVKPLEPAESAQGDAQASPTATAPTPAPIPTAQVPVDPGADGATVTLPGAGPAPAPPATSQAAGDGATTAGPAAPGATSTNDNATVTNAPRGQ